MQLGSKENENERFKHYLEKTFKKTASLIANSCKAVCTFLLNTNITELEKSLSFHTQCFLLTVSSVSFKVSILVNSDPEVHEIAYQYGKNVGIAFQVICDLMNLFFFNLLVSWPATARQPSTVNLIIKTESFIKTDENSLYWKDVWTHLVYIQVIITCRIEFKM